MHCSVQFSRICHLSCYALNSISNWNFSARAGWRSAIVTSIAERTIKLRGSIQPGRSVWCKNYSIKWKQNATMLKTTPRDCLNSSRAHKPCGFQKSTQDLSTRKLGFSHPSEREAFGAARYVDEHRSSSVTQSLRPTKSFLIPFLRKLTAYITFCLSASAQSC